MKKWIAFLLAFVMCLSLCACGGGGDSSNSNGQAEKNQTENADESANSKGDGTEITVEDIYCSEKQDIYSNYYMKVRNNTDEFVYYATINSQLLDEAGDSIYNFDWYFNELDSGQAVYGYEQFNDQDEYRLADAVSIKLKGYTLYRKNDGGSVEEILSADFSEPIVFTLDEIPMKNS